jgi:hypothetical protein
MALIKTGNHQLNEMKNVREGLGELKWHFVFNLRVVYNLHNGLVK